MTKQQFERTNAGHPIIFRVAYNRSIEGRVDSDLVIGDRKGRTAHPDEPRYVLYIQRLDNGATLNGIYEDDLPVMIHRALRMSEHEGLTEIHERLYFRA